jgi:hypothetical protein
MCYMLLLLFWEIYLFLKLRWIDLLGKNTANVLIDTWKEQEIFLSKNNTVLTGKPYTRCSCFWHKWFSFKHTCVSSTQLNRPICNRAYLHFEKPKLQEVIFSKSNQFSQGKKVLDVAPSNIDAFLRWDTCVSSNQVNKIFGTQTAQLHLEKPQTQEELLSKAISVLIGKQCARFSCF